MNSGLVVYRSVVKFGKIVKVICVPLVRVRVLCLTPRAFEVIASIIVGQMDLDDGTELVAKEKLAIALRFGLENKVCISWS